MSRDARERLAALDDVLHATQAGLDPEAASDGDPIRLEPLVPPQEILGGHLEANGDLAQGVALDHDVERAVLGDLGFDDAPARAPGRPLALGMDRRRHEERERGDTDDSRPHVPTSLYTTVAVKKPALSFGVRVTVLVALITLTVVPAHAQGPDEIREGTFVGVDGARFVLEGQAFHVLGANAAVMHGGPHRAHMRETLEAVAADGLGVVRVWVLGEYPRGDRNAALRAFRVGADGWVESSFVHLDAVLVEARRLNLRVVMVLANRWHDYGGINQYLRWAGTEVPRSPSISTLAVGSFWDCSRCEALYREHVTRVVGRTNSLSGVAYAADPTIFAWELINEAEAAGRRGEAAMVSWIERQAALVHELDPNHLVSAGHIGYSRLHDRELFRRVCALEAVSYCDSHAYAVDGGRVRSPAALARWIDDRVQLAHHVIGKPLLFGEVGFRTDRQGLWGVGRAAWFDRFLSRVLADGAAGALAWVYLPSEGERRNYGIYASGPRVRQTRDVRRILARHARRARRRAPAERNRRLGPERGASPIFDPTVRIRRRSTPHDTWTGDTLHMDPRELERAHFEGAGTWEGDPGAPHFYGAGAGEVSYRFMAPRGRPRALRLRLHASSELPGGGGGAGPEDTSNLVVLLDGVELGRLVAPPDDGVGDVLGLDVDPARLSELPRRRVHRLVVRADSGICLYARDLQAHATGIELTWIPRGPQRERVSSVISE